MTGIDRVQMRFTSLKLDHHKLSLGAAEEVLYQIHPSGTDSISSPYTIYFGFQRATETVSIRVTAACTLTEVNGKVLKSPLTLNPGNNTFNLQMSQLKIVTTASSVVEVTIK